MAHFFKKKIRYVLNNEDKSFMELYLIVINISKSTA